jgi:acyl dehydratase
MGIKQKSILEPMTNGIGFEMPVETGFKFQKNINLTAEEISEFAGLAGDMNPMHHDERTAKASRFGGIVASGPHSSALFMGSFATDLAPGYLVMGMTIDAQFREPLRPDTDLTLHWTLKAVIPKPRLSGYIVTIEGGIKNGETDILLATATGLLIEE